MTGDSIIDLTLSGPDLVVQCDSAETMAQVRAAAAAWTKAKRSGASDEEASAAVAAILTPPHNSTL